MKSEHIVNAHFESSPNFDKTLFGLSVPQFCNLFINKGATYCFSNALLIQEKLIPNNIDTCEIWRFQCGEDEGLLGFGFVDSSEDANVSDNHPVSIFRAEDEYTLTLQELLSLCTQNFLAWFGMTLILEKKYTGLYLNTLVKITAVLYDVLVCLNWGWNVKYIPQNIHLLK